MEPTDLIEPQPAVDPGGTPTTNTETDAPFVTDPTTPSQATKLVQIVERLGIELFHDDRGDGWMRLRMKDHQEHWPCRSKNTKRWLARLFWQYEGKAANSDALSAALNVIEAKARFEGAEYELHNRVAGDDVIWYDLSDPLWRAVRIQPGSWTVIADPPVLFRRFAHQRPQVDPAPGGDLHALLRFVNLRNPRQQLLLMVYIVSCFVPGIPHPSPVLYGPQGAAKTTFLRMLRRLGDPSITETLTAPKDIHQLVQQLSHHWMPYYDNLTSLPDWLSDAMCRAVTGDGLSKRELYTDDDDVIYSFRRCVGLNGINIAATKPDLLDRAILFGLQPIAKADRQPEKALWREFERARPQLFGAVLDTLARSLEILPKVHLAELHRMADFMLIGSAISQALGHSEADFLAAYEENFTERNDEILTTNPTAAAIGAFMTDRTFWRGTASELFSHLSELTGSLKIDVRGRQWPKSAAALTRRMNEVAPNLLVSGVSVAQHRSGTDRWIEIVRSDDPSEIHPREDDDDRDGTEMPSSMPSSDKGRNRAVSDDSDGDDGISATLRGGTDHTTLERQAYKSGGNVVTSVTRVIAAEPGRNSSDGIADDAVIREVMPSWCRACGGSHHWISVSGRASCATCHPPADASVVASWVGAD